jgi:23S rRNA pseudouridine2605 synthase
MALRRERGQERKEKRTVGKIASDMLRNYEAKESSGKRIGKTRASKITGQGKDFIKSKPAKTVKKLTTRGASTSPTRELKEKTSDVFRRNVILRKSAKSIEKAESDQYLNEEGKVLRGRFGRQKLHQELTSTPKTAMEKSSRKGEDTIRLNRYIANAGLCSRREADTFISTGCVSVNGKIISEMGYQVKPGDQVSFNGKVISTERKVYVLLNKPKGFVTTVEDPHAEKTVMDLVKSACSERIYPVGRLDKNTTGLLLLTNDGELTKRLTHPKYNRKKIYHVFLDKKVTKEHLQQIVDGIELEDGFVAADSVSYVSNEDKKQVGIEIHSGKNKIVRRIFEHFDYKVVKLDRVYFCGLTKKNLPRGKWRFLTQEELHLLQMSSR